MVHISSLVESFGPTHGDWQKIASDTLPFTIQIKNVLVPYRQCRVHLRKIIYLEEQLITELHFRQYNQII